MSDFWNIQMCAGSCLSGRVRARSKREQLLCFIFMHFEKKVEMLREIMSKDDVEKKVDLLRPLKPVHVPASPEGETPPAWKRPHWC